MGMLTAYKKKTGEEREEGFTYLGKDASLKGVVHFEGTVQIDGRIEGEVHSKGTLILGEHAVVKGIITADILISSGKIKGNVTANEKVELRKPALLVGEARTPSISVEDGAHLHGRCDMGLSEVTWDEETHRTFDTANEMPSNGEVAHALIARHPVTQR